MRGFIATAIQKKKSSALYCVNKHPIPNIFYCTAFKKYHSFLLDENQKKSDFMHMFMLPPSTLERKEEIIQWQEHVYLHPIDVSYDNFKDLNQGKDFNPAYLDQKELRDNTVNLFYIYMNKMLEISNNNLVRNADAYMSANAKIDPEFTFSWIDDSIKEGKEKFQLGY